MVGVCQVFLQVTVSENWELKDQTESEKKTMTGGEKVNVVKFSTLVWKNMNVNDKKDEFF